MKNRLLSAREKRLRLWPDCANRSSGHCRPESSTDACGRAHRPQNMRALTQSESGQQPELVFAFSPLNQCVGAHVHALKDRNGFQARKVVPRVVRDRGRRAAGSRERSQEKACLAAQHMALSVQNIRCTASAYNEVMRNRVAITLHGGGTSSEEWRRSVSRAAAADR